MQRDAPGPTQCQQPQPQRGQWGHKHSPAGHFFPRCSSSPDERRQGPYPPLSLSSAASSSPLHSPPPLSPFHSLPPPRPRPSPPSFSASVASPVCTLSESLASPARRHSPRLAAARGAPTATAAATVVAPTTPVKPPQPTAAPFDRWEDRTTSGKEHHSARAADPHPAHCPLALRPSSPLSLPPLPPADLCRTEASYLSSPWQCVEGAEEGSGSCEVPPYVAVNPALLHDRRWSQPHSIAPPPPRALPHPSSPMPP